MWVRRRPGGCEADGNVTLFIQAGVCYLVNSNVNLVLDSGFFKERPPLPVENIRE